MASIRIDSVITLEQVTECLRAVLGTRYPSAGGRTLEGSLRGRAIDLRLSGPTEVSGMPVYHTFQTRLEGDLVDGQDGVRFEGGFRRSGVQVALALVIVTFAAMIGSAGIGAILADARRGAYDVGLLLATVLFPLLVLVVSAAGERVGRRLAAIDQALMLHALRGALGSEQTT